MRSTVNDIARVTGLSPGTVSRALDTTGKYYVSQQARSAVEQAARELRYRPNMAGRSLVAGASKLVSLVSQAPFSNYYTHIAKKLSSFAAADGYCLINDCAFDPEGSDVYAAGAENVPRQDWLYGVDGMILCDVATR